MAVATSIVLWLLLVIVLLAVFLAGMVLAWALEITIFKRSILGSNRKLKSLFDSERAARSTAEKTLQTRDGELKAAKAGWAQTKTELADLKSRVPPTQVEIDAALRRAADLESQLAAALSQIDVLNKDKQTTRTDLDGANSQLKARASELNDIQPRLAKSQLDLQAREADLVSLREQFEQVQAGLRQRNDELAAINARLAEAKTALSQKDGQISVLQTEKASLAATIQAREDESTEANGRVQDLKGELDQVTAERARLEFELKELQAAETYADVPADVEEEEPAPAPSPRPDVQFAIPSEGIAHGRDAAFDLLPPRGDGDETPFVTACPQRLTQVKGITPEFQDKLYAAGIGSYWQLSQLSREVLKQLLQIPDGQEGRYGLNLILSEARRLARDTRSLGRVWNAEPADDLATIPGINERYLARLYDAGVCTFHALAGTSMQELEYICQPPAFDKPDYQTWIDQARGKLQS